MIQTVKRMSLKQDDRKEGKLIWDRICNRYQKTILGREITSFCLISFKLAHSTALLSNADIVHNSKEIIAQINKIQLI